MFGIGEVDKLLPGSKALGESQSDSGPPTADFISNFFSKINNSKIVKDAKEFLISRGGVKGFVAEVISFNCNAMLAIGSPVLAAVVLFSSGPFVAIGLIAFTGMLPFSDCPLIPCLAPSETKEK